METIFRKYRAKQREVWQLGLHEAPTWAVEEETGELFRPRSVLCLSLRTNRFRASTPGPVEPGLDAYVDIVTDAARAWKLRPERIEVADPGLAEALGRRLASEKMPVVVREGIPEVTSLIETWDRLVLGEEMPGILSGTGVTVERVAAFAQAAARFAEAAPWRHLSHVMDFLLFEAEGLPAELRKARLLGARSDPGILFQPFVLDEDWEDEDWEDEEPEEPDDETPTDEPALPEGKDWVVRLCAPDSMPAEDVRLWREHGLAVAHPKAYPLPASAELGEQPERPDALLLAWIEAILIALASTTEEEMDSGRWIKEVVASEGPVRLEISLPDVLRPDDVEDWVEDDSPVPRETQMAVALVTLALSAWGRQQIHLARRALELWPDCIDAWLILARRALDHEAARDLYATAIAVNERQMPGIHEREEFPEDYETLCYVWACTGFAMASWNLGDQEEAVNHLRKAMARDPRESQKIRLLLAHALLAQGENEEAEELLFAPERGGPDWNYARALLAYSQEGSSPKAGRLLDLALRDDRRMVKWLLGNLTAMPFGDFGWGAGETVLIQQAWRSAPGACEWLAKQARKGKEKKKKRKRT
jgi:hypothetical protein